MTDSPDTKSNQTTEPQNETAETIETRKDKIQNEATETTDTRKGEIMGPSSQNIEADAPPSFGLVQAWWGGGKGKTTAALGMAFRAAGHGYRVHVLQFMKGGADSVEDVRGEYNAIEAMPGISYENAGHYGWHGRLDDSNDASHETEAQAGLERVRDLLHHSNQADLRAPIDLDAPPESGVHMLVLDEILYAANRGLIDPHDVVELVVSKPDDLELVLTGGHEKPEYLYDHTDLVTEVRKEKHPFSSGHTARRGTEY